jgi:hypothetical protein
MENIKSKSYVTSVKMREHYCEMLQNVVLFSPVYGQAETHQGLPYYCNGEKLLVVGYSVNHSKIPLNMRISQVVSLAHKRWRGTLQSIQFWGPVCPNDIVMPQDFIRINERQPDHANRDVILLLDDVSHRRIRCGRDIRRAQRNGLTVAVNASKEITWEHRNIFAAFLQTHTNIEKDDIAYFASWDVVLKDKDSILIEVRQNGRLTGFAILSCFGMHTATYAYGFFNNAVAGTSDLAHAEMINFCHNAGFDMLDLGYSIHANLLRYKQKWGNTHLVDPPWSVHWQWRDSLMQKQIAN